MSNKLKKLLNLAPTVFLTDEVADIVFIMSIAVSTERTMLIWILVVHFIANSIWEFYTICYTRVGTISVL